MTLDRVRCSPHLETRRLLIALAVHPQIARLVSATARPRVEGFDCLSLLRDSFLKTSQATSI